MMDGGIYSPFFSICFSTISDKIFFEKVRKLSKTGQDQKTLTSDVASDFAFCILATIAKK